jgi:glutathione S-transferase
MTVTLYYAPTACSLVPYVTLTEANADFTVQPVNMGKRENMAPAYLALNPEHKVPTLVVDGRALTQNVAIQQWIARAYPQAKLLPSDPWDELKAISILAWCASGIHPHLTRHFAPQRFCDAPGSEDATRRIARDNLFENFAIAEPMLAGRDWFFDHFTAADAHFFWCFRRATQFNLDLSQFKNSTLHFERMKQRASVQKVLAYEAEVLAAFAKAA